METRLAIGITTTLERADIFHYCLAQWQKYLPENARIYTHVDIELKGICYSKNKLLEMCDYADHIVILDDDIYPIINGWHLPYIQSSLQHASYTFDRRKLHVSKDHLDNEGSFYIEYEKPNGCMMYFTKKCIETAGGWDLDFKGYGFEHVSLSDRIFNLGLTPARYIDINNSDGLFQMADCESSFSYETRASTIPINAELYQQKYFSKEFKPYK